MTAKLNQEYVEDQFEQRGCELLDIYKGKDFPIKFRCKCGKTSTITYGSFRRGSYCLGCSGKQKHTLREIKQQVESEGYRLLSKEYKNALTKMDFQCPQGHTYSAHWNSFQQGRRCPTCARETCGDYFRDTHEEIEKVFESNGCELLSEYLGNHKKVKYRCNCGRISTVTPANFKNGSRCKQCRSDNMSSDKHPLWIKDREEAKQRRLMRTKCVSLVKNAIKSIGGSKNTNSYKLLGYTPRELRERVESHPNWHSVKDGKWHLDHIFPIKAFCDYEVKDLSLINCLENLRPVKGRENLKKSGKYNAGDFETWLKQKSYEIVEV